MASKLEIIGIVFGGLASVGVFSGIGYSFGTDSTKSEIKALNQKLAVYETAENTKGIFAFLEDLKEYNDSLFEFEKYARQIMDLDNQVNDLANKNTGLSATIQQQATQISELQKSIESKDSEIAHLNEKLVLKFTVSEVIQIPEGKTHKIFDGEITLGLQTLRSSFATVVIFDNSHFLNVGESYNFDIESNNCRIVFDGIADNSQGKTGEFSLLCKKRT